MYSHCAVAALTQNEQAEWFRHRLGLHGVTLTEDPLLKEDPVAVSRETRTIWVPPIRDFAQVYRWANEALLYIIGGSEWAPSFSGRLEDPPLAAVLPFRRPDGEVRARHG